MLLLPIDKPLARCGRERIIQLLGFLALFSMTLAILLAFFLGKAPKAFWFYDTDGNQTRGQF